MSVHVVLVCFAVLVALGVIKAFFSLPARKASEEDDRVTFGGVLGGVVIAGGIIFLSGPLAHLIAGGGR